MLSISSYEECQLPHIIDITFFRRFIKPTDADNNNDGGDEYDNDNGDDDDDDNDSDDNDDSDDDDDSNDSDNDDDGTHLEQPRRWSR